MGAKENKNPVPGARTILIADDNPADVFALRRLIDENDVLNPITVVHDGSEALAYLRGDAEFSDRTHSPFPVLLFLDLRMPIPGTEVLHWLKENPHPALGVVVMTDEANLDQIRQAYQLGANSFLMKPVKPEDFLHVIQGLTGAHFVPAPGGGHYLDLPRI